MAALKNIAFIGASTAVRWRFGMLIFVRLVLVFAKRAVGFCRNSVLRCFDTSLYPMTAEIA